MHGRATNVNVGEVIIVIIVYFLQTWESIVPLNPRNKSVIHCSHDNVGGHSIDRSHNCTDCYQLIDSFGSLGNVIDHGKHLYNAWS